MHAFTRARTHTYMHAHTHTHAYSEGEVKGTIEPRSLILSQYPMQGPEVRTIFSYLVHTHTHTRTYTLNFRYNLLKAWNSVSHLIPHLSPMVNHQCLLQLLPVLVLPPLTSLSSPPPMTLMLLWLQRTQLRKNSL